MPQTIESSNMELMRTLDDSWNAQDWETFEKRHSADTAVFWPGQPEPTRGRAHHTRRSPSNSSKPFWTTIWWPKKIAGSIFAMLTHLAP